MRFISSLFLGFSVALSSLALAGCVVEVTGTPSGGGNPGGSGGSAGSTVQGGSGGAGGMGGEGGAPFCEAGVVQPCYSGAPGTAEIGTCRSGTRTCLPDGSAYSECEGEVFATFEPCSPQNCQGAPACFVDGLWSKAYESLTGQMGAVASVVAANGDIFSAGYLSGETNFGTGPIEVNSPLGVFVTQHSTDGQIIATHRYGDDSVSWGVDDMVIDSAGDLILLGYLRSGQTLELGGQTLQAASDMDAVLLKLHPNGDVVWAETFAPGIETVGTRLAVGPQDRIAWVGQVFGLPNDPTAEAMFVAELNSDGTVAWERTQSVRVLDYALSVAILPWDDVIVAGTFAGEADLGGKPLNGYTRSGFLVRYDDYAGNHAWSKSFGSEDNALSINDIHLDEVRMIVSGDFTGTFPFDDEPLTALEPQPFVAHFHPLGGIVWARALWGTEIRGAAVRATGDETTGFFVGGTFEHQSDVENGIAGHDIFITHLTLSGVPDWTRVYSGPNTQYLHDLNVSGSDLVITGAFSESVDFGSGALTATDNHLAMFLAKVHP